MATVLEECTTKEQRSVVHFFLWTKWLKAKDIHKKMFPAYSKKCMSHKAVHNWVEKFSQGRSKVADNVRPGCPAVCARSNCTRVFSWFSIQHDA
jgi:hypothetical protein